METIRPSVKVTFDGRADLVGKPIGEFGARPHDKAMQQGLNVISQDPVGCVLRRQDVAVNQRHTDHILQRMIGFLLGPDDRLIAFLATADDIEGDVEDVDFDPLDFRCFEAVLRLGF